MKSDIALIKHGLSWTFFVAYLETHTLLNLAKEESELET